MPRRDAESVSARNQKSPQRRWPVLLPDEAEDRNLEIHLEYELYDLGIDMFVKCLPVTFVIALIYIDRLQNANSSFIVNEYSVHR